MRIDANSTSLLAGVQPVTRSSEVEKSRYTRGTEGTSSAFNVQLTDLIAEIDKVQPSSGDLRMDKVNAIKEQLAQSTYNISGQDVAGKMLQLLKD